MVRRNFQLEAIPRPFRKALALPKRIRPRIRWWSTRKEGIKERTKAKGTTKEEIRKEGTTKKERRKEGS